MEHRVTPEIRVFATLSGATSALARHLCAGALEATRARGRFAWVLAGGHTPEALYRRLSDRYAHRFPWAQTEVYFGDERCVSPRSSQSNYAMARASLLRHVPVPRPSIHRFRGELRPPSRAVAEYARLLGPLPTQRDRGHALFDSVLLGIGPDGHTASLFPGGAALHERRRTVVAVPRSGQPPFVPRLSLTLPALASSREVVFLVGGAEKAEAISSIFRSLPQGTMTRPASLVRSQGPTRWFLDRAAAALLPGAGASAR
ncbi:MAG: 6-phosphogluconolactonase [Thermoplasmata archaeon]|nr:6-phosphogluconolactonase [Thermoplasmata archaeon]